jgi:hypothetical protein
MMSLVTLTAVSVVICFGPRRRPVNPFFLSSDVLSNTGQSMPMETMDAAPAEIDWPILQRIAPLL